MNNNYFNFIPIFNIHEIGIKKNPWTITEQKFEEFLQWLSEKNIEIISMERLVKYYQQGQYPQNKVVLTFDDGRKGILEHGLKILKKYNAPATIYLVYDWLHQKVNNDKEKYSEFLDIDDIAYLSKSHTFSWGYHTKTHCDITSLEESDITYETIVSKKDLEKELGINIKHFSYPYGKYTQETEESLKKNYASIATSERKWSNNVYHLSRISLKSYHTVEDYEKFFQLSEWYDKY